MAFRGRRVTINETESWTGGEDVTERNPGNGARERPKKMRIVWYDTERLYGLWVHASGLEVCKLSISHHV